MAELLACRAYAAGLCGSCTEIKTPYPLQLSRKSDTAAALLDAYFLDPANPVWLPPVASALGGFRNRAKFVVSGTPGALTLGLNRAGKGVDLTACPIQDPRLNSAALVIRDFLNSLRLAAYDVAKRRGQLKFVHLTVAPTGALLLRFVVRTMGAAKRIAAEIKTLLARLPQLETVTVNLLPEHKAVLEGDAEYVLYGKGLRLPLAGVELELLPQSFLQTNTEVAAELYAQAARWAQQVGPESVWDLYCGVGGFALQLAGPRGAGPRVTGVEISPLAVRAAAGSARRAGLGAQFIAGDATEFALATDQAAHPELLVLNPPRRGVGATLCAWLTDSSIEHVIYSSCNPVTLASDLRRLPAYRIVAGRVFDMFAHTVHQEVAVLLRRTS